MECQICRQVTSAPLRNCEVCSRYFHATSCGGTHTWIERDISDFDADDYRRAYVGRSVRQREITQKQCIICRSNDFGRHGVPPGDREWKEALARYQLRLESLERLSTARTRELEQERAKAAARAAETARQREVDATRQRELLQRKSHFAQLEPYEEQLGRVQSVLRSLKRTLAEARAEQSRLNAAILTYTHEQQAASDDRDRLADEWKKLRAEGRRTKGLGDWERWEFQIGVDALLVVESKGKTAARKRDRAAAELSKAQAQVVGIGATIQSLEPKVKLAVRELKRVRAERNKVYDALELDWQRISAGQSE